MSNPSILSCTGLSKIFQDGQRSITVLENVSLNIEQGERVAIIGRSGSGKSTLLHLLGGLDLPSQGSVSLAGQNLGDLNETQRGYLRNRTLGFVYQFHHLLPEFTALENVALPLLLQKISVKEAQEKARYLLVQVGLENRLLHKPGALSGGERQRVAIARALVTSPLCVLADEPTGNLDPQTSEQVYEMLLKINQAMKTSLVIVTHDQTLAERMDRILHLDKSMLE